MAERGWRALAASLPSHAGLIALLAVLAAAPRHLPEPPAFEVQLVELPQAAPQGAPAPARAAEPLPPEPAAPELAAPLPVPPPERALNKPSPLLKPALTATPSPSPPAETLAPRAPAMPPAPAASAPGGGLSGARAVFKPMPEPPPERRRHNPTWVARARFAIAADGSASVELIEPTSEPLLNRLLLEVLRRWRFFPALEDGKPVASTLELRIPVSVE